MRWSIGLGHSSDETRRRRRLWKKTRRLDEAEDADDASASTVRVSLGIPKPSEQLGPVSNASTQINVSCECTNGVPYDINVTCPDNSTLTKNCSGYAGDYALTCPSRSSGCAIWDGLEWVTPPNCVSKVHPDGTTTCVCEIPVKAEAFDITTAEVLSNAGASYVKNLTTPRPPGASVFIFRFLTKEPRRENATSDATLALRPKKRNCLVVRMREIKSERRLARKIRKRKKRAAQDRPCQGDIPLHRVGRAHSGELLGADDISVSFETLRVSDLVWTTCQNSEAHTHEPFLLQIGAVMSVVGYFLDKRDAAIHDAFDAEDDEEQKERMRTKSTSLFF